MSGTSADKPPAPAVANAGTDPSMEDILASIRRILNEDEAAAPRSASGAEAVLTLDASMRADEPMAAEESEATAGASVSPPAAVEETMEQSPPALEGTAFMPDETPKVVPLLAPEVAAATTAAMTELIRTLAEQQALGVRRGGPTLEDIVREELRPLLKAWLDQNLPPLVERVVGAEIQRLIGRAFP